MKSYFYSFYFFLFTYPLAGQVYTEKQTRHRFAQMTVGLDYQTNFGGTTKYLDPDLAIRELDLGQLHKSRLLIGATHFWGHADFYLAIPLFNPSYKKENLTLHYSSSVETVFKYYPWRIEHHKLRPYIGFSFAPFSFQQTYDAYEFGKGPELVHVSLPLVTGITYNSDQHLLEAGVLWNYANKQDYYISRFNVTDILTPPLYVSVSYKYMFETTLSAEEEWESGRTAQVTEALAEKGKLSGFFAGVGLSSSFWQGGSSYNDQERPYVMDYPISIMPDFAVGYYFQKPDMNITASYRGYGTSTDVYGAKQELKRSSVGLEVTKFLFDYHGFVPFVGPVVSYESLSFEEIFEDQLTHEVSDEQIGYGIAFGWDIRPNRLQTWILRTNLRWFPDLKLQVEEDTEISFDNVEFNFIQLIVFPGRIF